MNPMFLRELEQHQGTGPFADAIKTFRSFGRPVPQILHLFAFRPDANILLSRFTQAVMRGPSPLSPGMRELIAAFTSKQNHCQF